MTHKKTERFLNPCQMVQVLSELRCLFDFETTPEQSLASRIAFWRNEVYRQDVEAGVRQSAWVATPNENDIQELSRTEDTFTSANTIGEREGPGSAAAPDDLVMLLRRAGHRGRTPTDYLCYDAAKRIETQAREIERLTRSRDGWETDCGREMENRDFWKGKYEAEKARADFLDSKCQKYAHVINKISELHIVGGKIDVSRELIVEIQNLLYGKHDV